MHGRLKIKTTAEQQEAKRIEREKKLKLFKAGTKKIFAKRENAEHDDEALLLTKEFLQQNPDFYTLWSFRKEILLQLKSEKTEEELQSLVSEELDLTQNCLKKNPKSYCAWHHRFWSMEFMPNPDWNKELKLCSFFLSLDERNFHCWDYRRLVCKKCQIDPKDELTFTTSLIEKNFSNYSAWHYRSTLLPIVHPGSAYRSVDEETLLKEYELVQNAAFTDPNDQSVWFYHRWLLGRGEKNLEIMNLSVLKEKGIVVVLLSNPIKVNQDNCLKIQINGASHDVLWKPAGNHCYASNVWLCALPSDIFSTEGNIEITVELIKGNQTSCLSCNVNGSQSYKWKSSNQLHTFRSEISAATKDVLEKELESCEQLYELEPDNKWTLFTCVLLMRAIDSNKYQSTIYKYLDQLIDVDHLRAHYYRDLRSKFLIENSIENLPVDAKEVHLAKQDLSSLHHFHRFILMEKVDLSFNLLASVSPVCYLLSVQDLVLDGNKLTDCKDLKGLLNLKQLSMKHNSIYTVCKLEALATCSELQHLFLQGNPVADDPKIEEKVKALLGKITLDGKQL